MQTLVVNLPSREMPKMPRNLLPSTSAPHSKEKYPSRAQKSDLTRRVSDVLCQNEDKTPQYILYQ
jgi:hypothetical protein